MKPHGKLVETQAAFYRKEIDAVRGGPSTERTRLTREVENQYRVIRLSAIESESLDPTGFQPFHVVLLMMIEVARRPAEDKPAGAGRRPDDASLGSEHPNSQTVRANTIALLQAMGRSDDEIADCLACDLGAKPDGAAQFPGDLAGDDPRPASRRQLDPRPQTRFSAERPMDETFEIKSPWTMIPTEYIDSFLAEIRKALPPDHPLQEHELFPGIKWARRPIVIVDDDTTGERIRMDFEQSAGGRRASRCRRCRCSRTTAKSRR
jgi:hypothetical protein